MYKIFIILTLIAGIAIGYIIKEERNDDILKGCEMVASTVNDMLDECQWEEQSCQMSLIDQLERNKEMMMTFLRGSQDVK